jgi:hypothetical protein
MASMKTKAYLTLISGLLCNIVCGNTNAWGLYLSYISSWMMAHDPMANYGTLMICSGVNCFSESVGLVCTPMLKRTIGPLKTCILGGVMTSGGIIASAFFPNLIFFLFAYAIFSGFGLGILEMLTFEDVWIYFRHAKGKVNGVLFFGYGIAPAIFGAMFTFIVNPDNDEPSHERKEGTETNYYFESAVYDRVPFALLVLGIVVALISIVIALTYFPVKNHHDFDVEDMDTQLR